ncbi:PhzF family phenazine biosynthesis protein [Polymorphobacter sp.]|uniref:PhzF family phenazine biosynthesis protein n=1 Tax=Polymorphobacter sp. TaxID=1909290 RepID=UPI003F715720
MSLPYRLIHAFITPGQPLSGNPAAVLLGTPDDPQALAKALQLSALAIVTPAPNGAFGLHWFSPSAEIMLCGHGTMAAAHMLLDAAPDLDLVHFHTRHAGPLIVSRAPHDTLELALPALQPKPGYDLIELENEAEIRAYIPANLDPTVQTIITAPGIDTDIVSRVFVEGREDAVTGSAHALLAPWWAKRLGKTSLTARQASPQTGYLGLRVAGDRVLLTGRCHTLVAGQLTA